MTVAGLATAADAQEIKVADYFLTGISGAILEYDIVDNDGLPLGDIRKEVFAGDATDTIRVEGETTFQPPASEEHTATFSYREGLNAEGEFHPSGFDAETNMNGTYTASASVTFDEPQENFASLAPGEERTTSVRFTEESQTDEAEAVERQGTKTTVWKLEGFEEVTVPAGAFSAARIQATTTLVYDDDPDNPETFTETAWRVENLGAVKRIFEPELDEAPAAHELASYTLPATSPPTADPDYLISQDIGHTSIQGFSAYDAGTDMFTLLTANGSGNDIWGRNDTFHFLHHSLEGDGVIVARLATHSRVQAGIMIRENLTPDSRYAMIMKPRNSAVSVQRRLETGGFSFDTTHWGVPGSTWLRLERKGDRIIASFSRNGQRWQQQETITLDLPNEVRVGLFVASDAQDKLGSATFDSVVFPDYAGDPVRIAEAEATVTVQSTADTSSDTPPATVGFASTGGSMDPVEIDSFSLYLYRLGDPEVPIAVEYELSGEGAELLGLEQALHTVELAAGIESGTLSFEINEDAFIPADMNLTVRLVETDSYDLGGSDQVTFTILARPLDSWTGTYFTDSERTDAAVSGDAATPARDGTPNLVKYALGRNPRVPLNPEHLPRLTLNGETASLEYERPSDRTDIRYIVETSGDLENWVSGNDHVETTVSRSGETERVIARDRVPVGSEKQRFMRLRVERR